MQERNRQLARKRLDGELRHYRRAAKQTNATSGLLRAIRHVLRIPAAEIAEKMGVVRSVVFELEAREVSNSIIMSSVSRMADAMGCKLVYGIVPKDGKTLEELAEERRWRTVLGEGATEPRRTSAG